VPKSWKSEYHPHWSKVPPEVQEYVLQREDEMAKGVEPLKADSAYAKSLRAAIEPYRALLTAQGVSDDRAIQYLMNGHFQLSQADEGKRIAFVRELLKTYQIDAAKLATALSSEAPIVDPTVQPVLDRMGKLENALTALQQGSLNAQREVISKQVEAFASDPTHPYFDEVANEIALFLADPQVTLDQAYERAVWANPATRAKEQARLQQEAEKALREKAEKEAAAAAKARGTIVRGREGASAEPLGTMDETLSSTMKEIKSRAA
jgi:hypothetical protein